MAKNKQNICWIFPTLFPENYPPSKKKHNGLELVDVLGDGRTTESVGKYVGIVRIKYLLTSPPSSDHFKNPSKLTFIIT
jgi:hypothetical protein